MQTMDGYLGIHTYITPYCNTHQSNFNHCSAYYTASGPRLRIQLEPLFKSLVVLWTGIIYINVWEDAVGCWFVLFG